MELCFSPPEFVPRKQIRFPVLSKVEGSVNLLQVSGEVKTGEPLGVAFLQVISFVDPDLIAWERKVSRKVELS